MRHAATIACPITWPPNTRCQLVFGLLPRNRFTSIGLRIEKIEIRSKPRLSDIASSGADPDRYDASSRNDEMLDTGSST